MAASSGSMCQSRPTSSSRRPSASGRDGDDAIMMSCQPSPRARIGLPARHVLADSRARAPGSPSRSSIAPIPPSSAQSGRSVRSVVLDAV